MKKRRLGDGGPEVSEIGFGGWAIGGDWGKQSAAESRRALETAIDAGVNFIDTAAAYGDGRSERVVAEFVRSHGKPAVICTKVPPLPGPWPPSPYCDIEERFPAGYLSRNIEQRKKNLRTGKIDVLLLHTWTRAWNSTPAALETLRRHQQNGDVGLIGVSTPEHDQNSVIELMRRGIIDVAEVVYNLFEQEPVAELLPVAEETGTGVIVRAALDESALTGKYEGDETFAPEDFRSRYFAGDRLTRTVDRANAIKEDLRGSRYSLLQMAIKFPLLHPAVSSVLVGMRNERQALENCAVSDLPDPDRDLVQKLHRHNWRRGFWYEGK